MKYIPLGTGSCVPDYRKNSSGALLEINRKLILIDCGTGILHTITKTDYDYKDIDAIFITHLHLDHINDFPALLFALKNDPACHRNRDIQAFGPTGLKEYYKKIKELHGETVVSENYKVEIQEMSNSELEYGPIKVSSQKTYHTKNSIGFRFENDGTVFTSTGDTGYNENVVELCRQANTAVMECSAPQEYVKKTHLSPRRVGKIALEANVSRVIVNHLYPVMDKIPMKEIIKKRYQGKIEIAKVGKIYTI
ncbi:MAG: ribonuclease Z [Candidatus Cloacimonetes bacterium]|nr:ribonuclease Z [Candidatus Cloacimonadota bacterium]MBS3768105.1 ribonuclease Z [Candidatus Cloacimonadota bacterium]